jgi:hypothetical protein
MKSQFRQLRRNHSQKIVNRKSSIKNQKKRPWGVDASFFFPASAEKYHGNFLFILLFLECFFY